MNCNKNYLQHQGQKQSCMQGTQLIEIRHRSKNHLRLLMFLKRFQVNQVKEQGRYNRCEAWPYFNFKCFSYLHKMEFCIITQACDFGSNLSFQQQKNQIIFETKNKRDRRSMNAQISTHLSQGVHCPGRLSHNSSETSGL